VSKDKKKKKEKKEKNKGADKPAKVTKTLKALSENPVVADVVAAALVAMAAALKDSDKARRLADDAGDQLNTMSKKSAKQGGAMWELALDVGRRTLETLAGEEASRGKGGKAR
jgi:hypothetical protein